MSTVRGGLTLREAIQIMEIIHDTERLNAVDIVEVNPTVGTDMDVKKTIDAALHIILAAFGLKRSGSIPQTVNTKFMNHGLKNVVK